MYPDVTQILSFYRSPLGRYCETALADRVLGKWAGGADALRIAGFGHTSPLFTHWPDQAIIKANMMPAPMGVNVWPQHGANKSLLTDETALPLADESLDRIVICHALEHVRSPRQFLREIWRVTEPEGRIILIVPNRRSLWALSDRTPFGHGLPFSKRQLASLLEDSLFEATAWTGALYGLPSAGELSVNLSTRLEPWGQRLWPNLPGVWLVEAKKRVMAPLTGSPSLKQKAYAVAGLSSRPSSTPSSS